MVSRFSSVEDIRYDCHKVTTLHGWPGEATAASLLARAVEILRVLMQRHRWTIIHVMEFYPQTRQQQATAARSGKGRGGALVTSQSRKQPPKSILHSLNINRGEQVKVRLRPPQWEQEELTATIGFACAAGNNAALSSSTLSAGNGAVGNKLQPHPASSTTSTGKKNSSNRRALDVQSQACPRYVRGDCFYPFEHILCTLIHELCHNTIGPHNKPFWTLYHSLVAEAEEIVAEIQMKGSWNPDQISGGACLMGDTKESFGVGHRLGGRASNGPMRDTILQAAEARLGSQHTTGSPVTIPSSLLSATSSPPDKNHKNHPLHTDATHRTRKSWLSDFAFANEDHHTNEADELDMCSCRPSHSVSTDDVAQQQWACGFCTSLNHPLLPFCEVCGLVSGGSDTHGTNNCFSYPDEHLSNASGDAMEHKVSTIQTEVDREVKSDVKMDELCPPNCSNCIIIVSGSDDDVVSDFSINDLKAEHLPDTTKKRSREQGGDNILIDIHQQKQYFFDVLDETA